MHALIVEPDEGSAELLSQRLARLNIESEVAATATKAREILHERAFDFVFVEVCLENGPASGFELLFAVRGALQPPHNNVKLVIHSSYLSVPRDIDRAPRLAEAYLPKPYSFAQLVELVAPKAGAGA